MTCPHPGCGYSPVRIFEKDCPRCGRHCEYPNVRQARVPAEQAALQDRFEKARSDARGRGCETEFDRFATACAGSEAVMSRHDKVALGLLERENELWRSFYAQVDSGLRRPEETEIETARTLADDRLFPYFRKEILFGALSLNGLGPGSYGRTSMTIAEDGIQHRATVFEENSLNFVRGISFAVPPPGHRAEWADRGRLAGAKLGSRIMPGTSDTENEALLMTQDADHPDPDFVEVHIFGSLHGSAVSRVCFWPPQSPKDEPIRKQIRAICRARGIAMGR